VKTAINDAKNDAEKALAYHNTLTLKNVLDFKLTVLKEIAGWLGISVSGSKTEIAETMITFWYDSSPADRPTVENLAGDVKQERHDDPISHAEVLAIMQSDMKAFQDTQSALLEKAMKRMEKRLPSDKKVVKPASGVPDLADLVAQRNLLGEKIATSVGSNEVSSVVTVAERLSDSKLPISKTTGSNDYKHTYAAGGDESYTFSKYGQVVKDGYPTWRAFGLAHDWGTRNDKESRLVCFTLDRAEALLKKNPNLSSDVDWLDLAEVNFRRLLALLEAEETGDWSLASQMESLMTSSHGHLGFIRKQALKQRKLFRQAGQKRKKKKKKKKKGKRPPVRQLSSSSESSGSEEGQ
jgi:hypothetical protein